MKTACELMHPRLKVKALKVETDARDKAYAIMAQTKVHGIDLLVIGKRQSLSNAILSKMLDVVMKNIGITRRSKQMGSKSCPVSIKSSPLHDPDGNTRDERRNSFYSRDHSIQAAIAHCKKSFGK
ncbi:hypothetical protein CTI12_AA533020 [Artemisia annua]|uniref:UspA domain-containing protein n=1 Tax=Artemisia annua TaxID=35608 RepID=A0A2U1L3X9_ARTAN|nr:hypothetical protein CTI12_AA533020 [Artemisia annua]